MFKLRAKIMIEQYHKMNLKYIPRSIWRGCSMSTSCQALPSAQVMITNNLCLCFLVLKGDPTSFYQRALCRSCLARTLVSPSSARRWRGRSARGGGASSLSMLLSLFIVFIIIIFDLFEDFVEQQTYFLHAVFSCNIQPFHK